MAAILTPDICVIGAGSAGLTTAAAAAAFGVEVVLIERARMGGDCLNTGCVPSKALIAAAKHVHAIREAHRFGVTAGEPLIDFEKVHAHVHEVIAGIAPNDSVARFESLGVTVLKATAIFVDERTVSADGQLVRPRRFVIATGSSPFVPPIEGLGEVQYLTNESLFDLEARPEHLMIIGGGPIGMEMAQAHCRLGAKVTVFEGETALGRDDPELVAVALNSVRADGVAIEEGSKVVSARKTADGIRLTVETKDGQRRAVTGSHLLVAVGRAPNVSGMGLDAAGIAFDMNGITVGRDLRSTNKRAYAIGDVAGGPQFTHVAGYHGGLVLRALLFRLPFKADHSAIPHVTFTDPELGQVGLTEAGAREKGHKVTVQTWPYAENDRARTERQTDGLVKLVVGQGGRLLGAGVVGAQAGEMTNLFTLALSKGLGVADLRDFVSPYPTFSEIGKRAATAYYSPYTKRPLVRRAVSFLQRFG